MARNRIPLRLAQIKCTDFRDPGLSQGLQGGKAG